MRAVMRVARLNPFSLGNLARPLFLVDRRTPLIDDFNFGIRIFFRRGFLGLRGLRARANLGTAKPRASSLDVSVGIFYHRLLVLLVVLLVVLLRVVAFFPLPSVVCLRLARLVFVAAFLFVVLARFVALLRLRAGSPASSGIAGGNMPVGTMPPSMSNGKPPDMLIGGIGGVGGTCVCFRRGGITVHLLLRFLDAFFARFLAPALPKPCLPYAIAAAILRACSKLRGRYVAREVVILPVLLYSRMSFWISFDASVAFLFALPSRLFVLRGILITFLRTLGFYTCTMPLQPRRCRTQWFIERCVFFDTRLFLFHIVNWWKHIHSDFVADTLYTF